MASQAELVETPVRKSPVRPRPPVGPDAGLPKARRGFGLTAALLLVVAGASGAALHFYTLGQVYQSTDDAFVDGHIINVAPKVAGRVDRVAVNDNQTVHQGEVVVTLDPRDFQAASQQKVAARESVFAQVGAVQATIEEAQAHVRTLEATTESDRAAADASRAQADKATKDLRRIQELSASHVVSPQDLDAARASDQGAQATLQASLKKVTSDEAQVAEARARINTYLALANSVRAQTAESDANLQTARLNESYAEVRAPAEGRVTRKSVEPGNYVQAGQTLFALVPRDLWVTANFKENQIGAMRPGQPVEIKVDALPGQKFSGHVDSIQAGSGARFSLLPPENATGNYVKVVQRVPVKIVFDAVPETGLPLGPGESAVPRVTIGTYHYTPLSLGVTAACALAGVGLVLWLRSRPKRTKAQA